jgi:hypothetical protein
VVRVLQVLRQRAVRQSRSRATKGGVRTAHGALGALHSMVLVQKPTPDDERALVAFGRLLWADLLGVGALGGNSVVHSK